MGLVGAAGQVCHLEVGVVREIAVESGEQQVPGPPEGREAAGEVRPEEGDLAAPIGAEPGAIGQKRRSLLRRPVTPGMLLLVILGLVFFRLWVVETVIVEGPSMESTLVENDRVLVLKPLPARRFEVVVLTDPEEGTPVIKRVVGLPGDTIQIVPKRTRWHGQEVEYGGQLIVNGVPYEEPYATWELPTRVGPLLVPQGHYYVLGDNRDESTDSRDYGPVPERLIQGVAVAVVFPPSRIHALSAEARAAGPMVARSDQGGPSRGERGLERSSG